MTLNDGAADGVRHMPSDGDLCPNRVKPGHCRDVRRMTALAPKADFDLRSCDVADVPLPDLSRCSKLSKLYSITSSARASSVGGTVRPSVLGKSERDCW